MKPAQKILRGILLTTLLILISNHALSADSSPRGSITGGIAHEAPPWFKESFLEIVDDVDEASEEGKHVLLFFQLNGCPYCARMLEESFKTEPLTSFIQKHFDSIAINVQGDREIAYNEEISVTEKELSEILKVRATPAIVFLDENNNTVVRVNGYRAPERFQYVLEYVSSKSYQSTGLADFLQAKLKRDVYKLRDNPLFTQLTDLSSVKGPLMVIMEDGSCYDCNEFHDGILAHPQVQKEISPFTIVRLDADSDQMIIGVDGKSTTPREMAKKQNMFYRPGVLAFNQGQLIRRHDSLTFPHHFKESMRFTAGGFYKKQDYRSYSELRTEELLSQGVTIDLGRPKMAK
ncbi:MAG: thioredoxin fold domain-containing protein [Gammaproteobacteria bacterium]|nr:thioredoxin fold domain-containing protein [Gammaproteobacteria bacterium]